MVSVPLGISAYERNYAGDPVVRVENRFLEVNPTNLKEKISLLSRPGTKFLAGFAGSGPLRRCFSELGLFNSDLFVVVGTNLYRYTSTGLTIPITGRILGSGPPNLTWARGAAYQQLFIADGLLFQYYNGGTQATGTLTLAGGTTISTQVVQIGPTYYAWNANVDTGSPAGTLAAPWLANPGTDPLAALANLIAFNGVPGVDFSSALGGPSTIVTSQVSGGPPAGLLNATAISEMTDGNAIATAVTGAAGLTWGAATLAGGGIHVLHGISMPDGLGANALAALSDFVLVSVSNAQQFYFLNPGETVIDALNFASKESRPDPIVDMMAVGDNVLIMGAKSTETWYATGNIAAPFAPIAGRTFQRGVVRGTACVVKDAVLLVGEDGIVYSIGYIYGSGTPYGVNRISHHGIEERIRVQLRAEQGIT